MQGKGAVGEVKGGRRQAQLFKIRALIGDDRAAILRPCDGKHPTGHIEPQYALGTSIAGPATEPAIATAKVDNPKSTHTRQLRSERRPFGRPIQALPRARELCIARKEPGVVINILCHRSIMPQPALPAKLPDRRATWGAKMGASALAPPRLSGRARCPA